MVSDAPTEEITSNKAKATFFSSKNNLIVTKCMIRSLNRQS